MVICGVLLVVVAIVCNGMAAGKKQNSGTIGSRKGIVLATIAGVLMSFFTVLLLLPWI